MNRLTRDEILFILELLSEKTVVESTQKFPYRISCKGSGYSDDKRASRLQAKLSILLEMADQ